ncbi:MAG: PBP1A family penicillin-binding protein [Elusimicrobia bacterium]|nr:PBP1A family penicillin-binding protein [Elusimicrobiota bacterium]
MWRRVWYGSLGFLFLSAATPTLLLRKYISELPPITSLDRYTPSLTTKLYDIHNQLITELFTERRSFIPLNQIPVDLQNAFIAIEDNRFFTHWGIDLRGISRAAAANLRRRRMTEGGSTITQQLSKVIFLTQEKTLQRKLKELLLAIQLERNFSKQEIFQLYLNQIYFGNGAYGVESASRIYFGKHVKDLQLAECALLAGLPRLPQRYSPFHHPDLARGRRAVVLARMRERGFITREEEARANAFPLNTQRFPIPTGVAPYFVEQIRLELEPIYGSNAIYRGGLSIYTTLDLHLQQTAETVLEKNLAAFDAKRPKTRRPQRPSVQFSTDTVKVQGAFVAVDPKTGGIRMMVGGRDFRQSQFNRVTQAFRQPGSTFKPFVWTAALEHGFTPATIVPDAPIAFQYDGRNWQLLEKLPEGYKLHSSTGMPAVGSLWVPANWDNKFFGPVTLRRGLAHSRNLVSIRLVDRVGPATVVDYAHRLGIQNQLQPVLSIALGTELVTLLEMTSAFGALDNAGIATEPFMVLRVEDKDGKVLEDNTPKEREVLAPQTAYLVVNLMKAVVEEGTGRRAKALGRPVAAKTGTTQDWRDLWFIGMTPDLVVGAWMGYDDYSPLGKDYTSAGTVVPWWTEFMAEAVKDTPVRDFPIPDGITFAKIDEETGQLASWGCRRLVLEAFRKGTEPTELCSVDHTRQTAPPQDTEE